MGNARAKGEALSVKEYFQRERLRDAAPKLLKDAEAVVASWTRGNLAAAVTQLSRTINAIKRNRA